MTREEAIQILSTRDAHGVLCGYTSGVTEAIDMAIEALSAEADGEDLIIKGAKGIQDGLYNIKDGKLFKYKAKGGTVRTYPIVPSADAEWIPCSERLPKEDEYVDDVCKYYLIQDEYGDMHVAHLSGRGWETIESTKALGCDVVAWMPLPTPYKGGDDE